MAHRVAYSAAAAAAVRSVVSRISPRSSTFDRSPRPLWAGVLSVAVLAGLVVLAGSNFAIGLDRFSSIAVTDSVSATGPMAGSALEGYVEISWTVGAPVPSTSLFTVRRNGTLLGVTASNVRIYEDMTPVPGTTYEYCIGIRAANNTETPLSCDSGGRRITPPSAFAASDGTFEQLVELTWQDNSQIEGGYNIYREGGRAIMFDGIDDYLSTSDVDLAGSYTFEFWAKRASTGTPDFVLNIEAPPLGDPSRKDLEIGFTADNRFSVGFGTSLMNTPGTYPDLDWHHWAVVYDAPNRRRMIFRDGELVVSETMNEPYASAGQLEFGRRRKAGSATMRGHFHGQLDEIRLWRRALTPSEVRSSMNSLLRTNETALSNYWPLDGTEGIIAHDVAGGLTATLRNMSAASWSASGVPPRYAWTAANISSFNDRSAEPGFIYTYRIAAFQDMNSDGRYTAGTDYESDSRTDTGWRGYLSPPGNVAATDGQFLDRVRITWADRSAAEEGFRIYRNDTPIGTVGANATTFDDLTMAVLETHVYCVASYTGAIESVRVCDDGRAGGLAAPENVAATRDQFDDRIRVTWNDVSQSEDGFEIFRNQTLLGKVGANVKEYVDLTAAAMRDYEYCVRAFSNADPLSPSFSDQACAPTPGRRAAVLAPDTLVASKDFEERIDLRWTSRSTTAMLFLLYRGDELIEVLDYTRSTATDRRIASDTDIGYCVAAATVVDQSLDAAKATVSQILHDFRTQDAVRTASGLEPSRADVRAQAVYDALGVQASAGKASVAAFDAGYVESAKACGTGRRSLNAPVITSISNDLESHVRLEWTDASSHEEGFVIMRTASGGAAELVDSLSANRSTYSDYRGRPGVPYTYSIHAFDRFGRSTASTAAGSRALKAPTQFTASDGVSETLVRLSWRDNSAAERGYRIFRRVGNGADSLIASIPRNEVGYDDLVPDSLRATMLTYRLAAFDDYGESESPTASGKTFIRSPASVSASTVYSDRIVTVWVDRSAIETDYLLTIRKRNFRDSVRTVVLPRNATRYEDTPWDTSAEYEYCAQARVSSNGGVVASSPVCGIGRRAAGGIAGGGGNGGDPGVGTDGPIRVTDSSLNSVRDNALRFGHALGTAGSRVLVGIPGADDRGQASFYTAGDLTPTSVPDTTLVPDPIPGAEFGYSVALSGAYALVGDPFHDASDGAFSGYRLNGSTWTRIAGTKGSTNLGIAVALADSFAVIGDNLAGSTPNRHGRAVVCNLEADSTCASAVRLDSLVSRSANAEFGKSVAITRQKSDTADWLWVLVGEPGQQRAHVFECNLETSACNAQSHWARRGLITSPFNTGQRAFGEAVAIDGSVAVVGDPLAQGIALWTRAADSTWAERPPVRGNVGGFGRALRIRGSTVLVGAPEERIADRNNAGAMYVYEWTSTTLERRARYDGAVAGSLVSDARFGAALAFAGSRFLVGAPNEGGRGAVYSIPADYVQPSEPIIPEEIDLNDPTRVRASDGTAPDRIQVRWTDNSDNEAGHVIFRSNEVGGFERLAEVSANVEFFDDFSAAPGEAYTYCVAAFSLNPYAESGRACDIGWRPANGTIAGRVFTAGGAGTDGADVCLSPSLNRGLLFDGAAGNVIAPINVDDDGKSPLDLQQRFAIEAWVRPHDVSGVRGIVTRPGAYELRLEDGEIVFAAVESDGTFVRSLSDTTIAEHEWSHIAVVKDSGNDILFFLNGDLVATDSRTLLLEVGGADSLLIGRVDSLATFFNGEIDELRIWAIELTEDDIAARMSAALSGKEEALVGYWPMDEGRRLVVPDLTPSANHGHLVAGVYLADDGADLDICGRTTSDGNYSIARIRYGEITEFDVAPQRAGRTFSPSFKKITLSIDSPVQNEVFFNDITAYTVAGSAFYRDVVGDETFTCPIQDVVIHVDKGRIASDDNVKTATGEDGAYSVSVDPSTSPSDTWSIIARGPSTAPSPHTFTPALHEIAVTKDTFGVDFFSQKRNVLAGFFSGGDPATCGQDIGKATIRIFTQDGCYDRIITVDSRVNNGAFPELKLPPLEYLMQVVKVEDAPADRAEDIADFFRRLGAVEVDLTQGNAMRNLTYRAPLTLQIAGLEPTAQCVNSGFTVRDGDGNPLRSLPAIRVIDEYDFVPLTFSVTENYGNGNTCEVGDGTVTIFDAIADRADSDSTMAITDGVVNYVTQGTSPNIFAGARIGGVDRSFQKPITVVAQVEGRPALMETEWAIVNGFRERAATFVSATTEEFPLLVLHDPPGSQSVAYIEEGSTYCSSISKTQLVGGGAGLFTDVVFGFKSGVGFSFGAHIDTEVGAGLLLRLSLKAGQDVTSLDGGAANNRQICLTATKTLSTSDDPGWVGEDLIVGTALNLIFALADVLEADDSTCTVDLSETLATDIDSAEPFATTYTYGRSHIESVLIPQLVRLIELAGDPSITGPAGSDRPETVRLRDAVRNWNRHLTLVDKLKDDGIAAGKDNVSFSGGSEIGYSTSETKTETIYSESTRIYLDTEGALGLIISGGYDQIPIAAQFEIRGEWVSEKDSTVETSTTFGYSLADNDGGDYFSVDVGRDPRYNTFVFKTVAGRSSNPCEENTQCRDNPIITVDPPVRHNVNPAQAANFQLTLINASESMERRRYVLAAPPEKNPHNLTLNVGGGLLTAPREYLLDPGKALTINLDAYASPSAFSYKDVAVMLYPPDEWPLWAGVPETSFERSDTAFFSVYFDSTRGGVLTAQMLEGWNWFSINSEGGDVATLLGGVPASHGDILRSQRLESRYDSTLGWTGGLTRIAPGEGYRLRLKNPSVLRVAGEPVEVSDPRDLTAGWTWIGYLPTKRMPVDLALRSLQGRVIEGDVIVGQHGFAHYVKDLGWVGTLRDMVPGEAYAIHLDGGGSLLYPPSSEEVAARAPYVHETTLLGPEWSVESAHFDASMTVVAEIQHHGIPLRQTTTKVAAFDGEEIRGVGEVHYVEALDRYLAFIMIHGDVDGQTPVVLHVFDGEKDRLYEEVASITFGAQSRIGQPASPVVIDLANAGNAPELTDLPEVFALHPNFPNPFSTYTVIPYDLPEASHVRIVVYDLLGRRVSTLVDAPQQAGRHRATLNPGTMASGVYFYQMELGEAVFTGKMILVR